MFSANIVSTGNSRYHVTTRHSHFEMASDGTSSKPVDALLASLCGCLGYYVSLFLNDEKVHFTEYRVSATSDLTEDQTRLADINVNIEIEGTTLNETMSAALLTFIKRCYIHNTLKANSQIHMRVLNNNTSSVPAQG